MARKTVVVLHTGDPAEDAKRRFERAYAEYDAHWRSMGKMIDDNTITGWKKGVTREKIKEADDRLDRLQHMQFQLFDAWQAVVKHGKAVKAATENAADDDITAIIEASLEDKMDELQFNATGAQLAFLLAESVHDSAVDADYGDPPLCSDCE